MQRDTKSFCPHMKISLIFDHCTVRTKPFLLATPSVFSITVFQVFEILKLCNAKCHGLKCLRIGGCYLKETLSVQQKEDIVHD